MRLGILISGRGSNMRALLRACADPNFPATPALVISNEPDAAGLETARAARVPTRTIVHRDFQDREGFEAALDEALRASGADLVCLAGFMRLLGDAFVTRWHDRMLNIHPSLLPAFKGLDTHRRAIEAGVRLAGCTVHLVRPAMDSGPILLQAAVPVLDDDTPASLAERVLAEEHRLYPAAVRLMAEGRVRVIDERAVIAGATWPSGALISPST